MANHVMTYVSVLSDEPKVFEKLKEMFDEINAKEKDFFYYAFKTLKLIFVAAIVIFVARCSMGKEKRPSLCVYGQWNIETARTKGSDKKSMGLVH